MDLQEQLKKLFPDHEVAPEAKPIAEGKELWGTSRYSIPFFMHPVSDMRLDCLENCIDENNPKLYDDISAGAFLHERLVDLGLVKK
jgi:hypothetical protein